MNYAMQISASGALASLYRMDVFASNLANASTTGFRASVPETRMRDAARIEDGLGAGDSAMLIERLGAGVQMAPNRLDTQQGAFRVTGSPLDVAIQGSGFFAVRAGGGENGAVVRLSRDGRLTTDASGRLVRTADGLPVLDASGREIEIPAGAKISIDARGVIRAGGETVGRLQIIEVADPSRLRPEGRGLLAASAEDLSSRRESESQVLQGMIEESGVDEFEAMMKLTDASRAAQTNLGMISNYDRIMEQAITGLGRVG